MFKTKVTEMLKIKYPIIGGTMMSISNADFTAAISEAGGLGILASAIYNTDEEFAEALDRVKELTGKPFAVNLNLFPAMHQVDNSDYLKIMIEKGVMIVETSGHSAPTDLYRQFKQAGMIWIHKCAGTRYARKVSEMGADIVTVVGYENGGATGKYDVGTQVLVPATVDALDIPVVGGGGVSDGRGLLAILALGAEGVIVGTRLMATKECPIHDNVKQELIQSAETDTMLIMRSINSTHRVLNNQSAHKCLKLEKANAGFEDLLEVVAGENTRRVYFQGDLNAGIVSCGQGIGLTCDTPTVKELFDRMINQATRLVDGFSGSLMQ